MNLHKLFKAGCRYITDSDYRFLLNAGFGRYASMPDEEYLRKKFKVCMGKTLDLGHPQTFNEKLQWLKLYDRKPEYTMMVDKYLVRDYIAKQLGEEYLIPLLGVWDDPDEIDFDALPNRFALKCNHNSGLGMCICRDKSKLDIPKVKKELRRGLEEDYYLTNREWPYKDVPRKIIAEQFMRDESAENPDAGLIDYKFYCFHGEPLFLYVSQGLENPETARIGFVNIDWTMADFGRTDYLPLERLPKKPRQYDEMIKIAKELSVGIPFLRVDLYEINGKIYFGELTFTPCAGLMSFKPETWDKKIGDMLTLPKH